MGQDKEIVRMKMITLIFVLMFCATSQAGWVAQSKVKSFSGEWAEKSICQINEGEKCFDATGKDLRKWRSGFLAVLAENTVDCDDSSNCQAAIDSNSFRCSEFQTARYDDKANWPTLDFEALEIPRPATGWFLWCEEEGLEPDPAGTAAADAEDAAKATKDAEDAAIETAIAAMDCGRKVVGLLLVRNQPKNLTTAQVKQMNADYATIKDLLETGSLVSAKEEIEALVPDGTIVTTDDQTALAAKIDECLAP